MDTKRVGFGPDKISIDEAASRMRQNFESMDAERRAYIIRHFLPHCRSAGMIISLEFIEAFELAAETWKNQS